MPNTTITMDGCQVVLDTDIDFCKERDLTDLQGYNVDVYYSRGWDLLYLYYPESTNFRIIPWWYSFELSEHNRLSSDHLLTKRELTYRQDAVYRFLFHRRDDPLVLLPFDEYIDKQYGLLIDNTDPSSTRTIDATYNEALKLRPHQLGVLDISYRGRIHDTLFVFLDADHAYILQYNPSLFGTRFFTTKIPIASFHQIDPTIIHR